MIVYAFVIVFFMGVIAGLALGLLAQHMGRMAAIRERRS